MLNDQNVLHDDFLALLLLRFSHAYLIDFVRPADTIPLAACTAAGFATILPIACRT